MKYWQVNFERDYVLTHGLKNSCWLMGYQYSTNGDDDGRRKSSITRNWHRLEEIAAGDCFAAYLPTNQFFAVGTVVTPKRAPKKKDIQDEIGAYLKRRVAYDSGFIYFPPSVAYENFEDECNYPVRVDVQKWEHKVLAGVQVDVPAKPRFQSVYAAVEIDQETFELIKSQLANFKQRNSR